MKFRVFDITKPLLSDEAEQDVEARTMAEAVEQLATLAEGQYIKRVKRGGRFVVYNPDARRIAKYEFGIFTGGQQ